MPPRSRATGSTRTAYGTAELFPTLSVRRGDGSGARAERRSSSRCCRSRNSSSGLQGADQVRRQPQALVPHQDAEDGQGDAWCRQRDHLADKEAAQLQGRPGRRSSGSARRSSTPRSRVQAAQGQDPHHGARPRASRPDPAAEEWRRCSSSTASSSLSPGIRCPGWRARGGDAAAHHLPRSGAARLPGQRLRAPSSASSGRAAIRRGSVTSRVDVCVSDGTGRPTRICDPGLKIAQGDYGLDGDERAGRGQLVVGFRVPDRHRRARCSSPAPDGGP